VRRIVPIFPAVKGVERRGGDESEVEKRREKVRKDKESREQKRRKREQFFVVCGSRTVIWNQGGEYLLLRTESTSSRYTTQGANRLRVWGERESREEGRGEERGKMRRMMKRRLGNKTLQ
jgi:hypothetical protein